MSTLKLERLLSDRALLAATCEALAKHMNGRRMHRLRFLLAELALRPDGGSLFSQDREWLTAGMGLADDLRGRWEAELTRLRSVGVNMVACIDAAYPVNLTLVHDSPPLLFVRGALNGRDRRAVAIVGTRKASKDGLDLAQRLASGVVEKGYTVVGGLAAGIDTAAHAAAVNAGGRTIAVLGTDVERVYPASNRALAEAVCSSGACVSQFLPGSATGSWSFPARNLTTSGLSLATVVVEASATSGARHQAEAALEHGRPVFLVESLVTRQRWADEMASASHGAHVVGDEAEIVQRLERHLEIVADSGFVFA